MISNKQLDLIKSNKRTPGKRFRVWVGVNKFFEKGVIKKLSVFNNSRFGRNNAGQQTVKSKQSSKFKFQTSFFLNDFFLKNSTNIFYNFLGLKFDKKTQKEYSVWSTSTGFLFKLPFNFDNIFFLKKN